MSKFGKGILLKYDGDITTIKCNKNIDIDNPKLKHIIGIVNKGEGEICQIGSWEDIDLEGSIFYIYGWTKGEFLKKNNIILPHPYDDLELFNDIVIIKTDIQNTVLNLSEEEYETFYKEISGIVDSDCSENIDNESCDLNESCDEIDESSDTDSLDNFDDDLPVEKNNIHKECEELELTDEEC